MICRRAVLFASITVVVPLAACKLLSKDKDEADAAPPAVANATNAATPTPAQTQTAAPSALPAMSAAPSASEAHRKVVIKLADGGTATVNAQVGPDGSLALPAGFSIPPIAGFDAAALKLPAFDAASIPPLPSGFPKIPGFGQGTAQPGGNK